MGALDEHAVLERFVEVFCREKHASAELPCTECRDLLGYAKVRLEKCPYLVRGEAKPKCKDCPIHCYQPEYRARVREVMRYSGMHFVKRGRLDWLLRYFLGGIPWTGFRLARKEQGGFLCKR